MEDLIIEQTKYSPLVQFNFNANQMLIKGKSYPENTFEFYEPVMQWLEDYFSEKKPTTTFTFAIVYYNSSSSKILFEIFSLLESHAKKGQSIEVKWIYNTTNETIQESGEDFIEDFTSLDIKLELQKS